MQNLLVLHAIAAMVLATAHATTNTLVTAGDAGPSSAGWLVGASITVAVTVPAALRYGVTGAVAVAIISYASVVTIHLWFLAHGSPEFAKDDRRPQVLATTPTQREEA